LHGWGISIRVPGKDWVSGTEHHYESHDMRGPILNLIPRIMAAILDDLPTTFRFDDASGKRVDVPVIPARVIREATVNAIMHRNYQTAQPIQVIRYANRLEIRNPGYSLKSQEVSVRACGVISSALPV
jgi:ATP-dependent DNA helicase RecG